tara:strand:- start:54 stop:440 length:387 start_codon:yes stop_codon:yes gene_type:complete
MSVLIKSNGKGMPKTLQTYFNIAWKWANREGFTKCVSENDPQTCVYRSEDGENACLIGAAIPDCMYTSKIEDNIPSIDYDWWCDLGVSREVLDYLVDLQCCHDENDTQKSIVNALQLFSETHNLSIPE